MTPAFSICVYCGSRPGNEPGFAGLARAVGDWIGRHGGQLVYGGGNNGLMGVVADATLAAGGRVVGIIPKALMDKEIGHKGLTELRVVGSMHERKAMMADLAESFIAMPGGFGTFDEFFEILTWAQLGMHRKPCAVLNTAHYFDPLIALFDQAVNEGFVRDSALLVFLVISDEEDNYANPPEPQGGSTPETATFIKDEEARWREVIRSANVILE